MSQYAFEVSEIAISGEAVFMYSDDLMSCYTTNNGVKSDSLYNHIVKTMKLGGTCQWAFLQDNTFAYIIEDIYGTVYFFKINEDDKRLFLRFKPGERFYVCLCIYPFYDDLIKDRSTKLANYVGDFAVESIPLTKQVLSKIEDDCSDHVICMSCGFRMSIYKGLGTVKVECPQCNKQHIVHT